MIKAFAIQNTDLEINLFPNYYLFKQRIKKHSERKDIISFNLGDKDVLEVLTDGEHAGQKFVEQGALFIKNSSVKRYSINEFDGFYITHEKNNTLKRSKLQKNDVLFTTIGNIGISAVVNENVENANINQNVVRMKINTEITTPQYLSCFLNSKITRFQVDNLFSGNIYPMLSYPKIKSLKIFIKDKKTECTITQNLIKAEQYQVEALLLIKQAQDIFVKALNIDYSKIKNSKFFATPYKQFLSNEIMNPAFYSPLVNTMLEEIKRKNKCVLLGNVAERKTGHEVGSVNYKGYLDRKETDVPFIRTSDILNYEIDTYPDFFIDKDLADSFKQNLQANDIIYTNDGKIGLCAMLTDFDKCIIQSHISYIRATNINPYYLFIALITREVGLYQSMKHTVTQTTIPTISNNILNFIIPVVEKDEKIITLTNKAFELKNERKSLINESRLLLENSLDF